MFKKGLFLFLHYLSSLQLHFQTHVCKNCGLELIPAEDADYQVQRKMLCCNPWVWFRCLFDGHALSLFYYGKWEKSHDSSCYYANVKKNSTIDFLRNATMSFATFSISLYWRNLTGTRSELQHNKVLGRLNVPGRPYNFFYFFWQDVA